VQERKKIIADAVFLNVGSAGTTRLLVTARAKDLIPRSARRRMQPGGSNGGPACVGGRDRRSAIPITTWAYDAATDDARLTRVPDGDADLLSAIRARIEEFARVGGS